MQNLSKAYISSMCELKSMSNEMVALGRVTDVTGEYIEIGCHTGTLPIVHANSLVKLQVYNDKNGFKLLMGLVYLSTQEMMRIIHPKVIVSTDRRKFFRVSIQLPAKVAAATPATSQTSYRLQWKPALLLNISLNGVYFTSKQVFIEDQQVAVQMHLHPDQTEMLHCRILNVEQLENDEWGYGCQFLSCTPYQSDMICNFIFEEQRRAIQQAKQDE